ncbi:hypothetical protein [Methanococcoides seepicolus]|jgi:hypothetical protein|uniref:Uncharacterized protein n=1 Tax=Methanococcoides seepicolus TaxID=2828780 RepID=A0A9E4ZER3_9EURY|nr:hypothetical protein [Methanococcoides seepicolus]MCM1986736.1 hypothetical protein [Methanococcoides seepicolus]
MRYIPTLLLALLTVAMIASPSSAFEWKNTIILEEDGMSWSYEESYSGEDVGAFRSYADKNVGNGDGYISAWELMKLDHRIRSRLYGSLGKELDVMFDNSAKNVNVFEVDAEISRSVLGSTDKTDIINNRYFVTYTFEKDIFELGDSVSFDGEANTGLTITMPEGMEVIATEGIDSRFVETIDNRTVISGHFGIEGLATVEFSRKD